MGRTMAQMPGGGVQYFDPGFAHRHYYNPALAPRMGYVSIPLLGRLNVVAGTNLGLSDLVFPTQDGRLVNFMNASVSPDQFLSGLDEWNKVVGSLSLDVISAGWHRTKTFWNFGVRFKTMLQGNIPKGFFEVVKRGMYQDPTVYHVQDMDVSIKSYMEASVGFARNIGAGFTIGANLKFLVGVAEAEFRLKSLDTYMGADEWRFSTAAEMSIYGPLVRLNVEDGAVSGIGLGEIRPSGYGGAVDLGMEYHPTFLPGLRVSVSVLDLGMIGYSAKDVCRYYSDGTISYKGAGSGNLDEFYDESLDGLFDKLTDMFEFHGDQNPVSEMRRLNTVLNLAAEYSFWNGRFGIGLLNTNTFYRSHTDAELSLIASLRPLDWISLSLSYSFIHGREGLGWALNITPKVGLNIFVASNYTSFVVNPQMIPLNHARMNLQFGVTVPLRGKSGFFASEFSGSKG